MTETGKAGYTVESGNAVLGIEFGSTRIKGVLIDEKARVIAEGSHEWENELVDGLWSYSETAIWEGLRSCYKNLAGDVQRRYGVVLTKLRAIGISAMQHGYMAFDGNWNLLAPFRTWRNTNTSEAAQKLTELFHFNIPQRWSVAHLYQAMLDDETHLKDLRHLATLASYVYFRLTGENITGINDASGMFPIDEKTGTYREDLLRLFAELPESGRYVWDAGRLFPSPRYAGENGGILTKEGAALLDPSGVLCAGIPLCPPEGDGGTGMAATNCIAVRTGHVSAGTSIFGMLVLERPLAEVHPEIDLVVTPNGHPVGMAHANNCTTDINDWVGVFGRFAELLGKKTDRSGLFELLYREALNGEADGSGLTDYNFFSGEPIVELTDGRPLFVREKTSGLTLANFFRVKLYSALSVLKIGMDIMLKDENVRIDHLLGHGGFFKTEYVGQKIMADMLNVPVTIMENAGEGGAFGTALLADFAVQKQYDSLEQYLSGHVFDGWNGTTVEPDAACVEAADRYIARYKANLSLEKRLC